MPQRPSLVLRSSELRAARGKPRLALRGELDGLRAENIAQENYLTRVRPLTATVDQILAVQTANTASFSAHKNGTAQTISGPGDTKITFPTEVFDIGGYYDTTNSRWTPPAGTALLSACAIKANIAAGSTANLHIYKNGSVLKTFLLVIPTGTTGDTFHMAIIDPCDGDDYYEVFSQVSDVSYDVLGSSQYTWFMGTMV